MRGRTVKASNLYGAEEALIAIGNAVHELSLEVGVAGDSIHFDDATPTPMLGALERVGQVKALVDRVEGLLRGYEMMRKPTEGETDDNAAAR